MGKTTIGFIAMVLGVMAVIAGLRLGTEPELSGAHRAIAGALAPIGVVLLVGSHRLLRANGPASEDVPTRPIV